MKTFEEALRATMQSNPEMYGPNMTSMREAVLTPLFCNFIRMAAGTIIKRVAKLSEDDELEMFAIISGVLAATFNSGVLVGIEMEKP